MANLAGEEVLYKKESRLGMTTLTYRSKRYTFPSVIVKGNEGSSDGMCILLDVGLFCPFCTNAFKAKISGTQKRLPITRTPDGKLRIHGAEGEPHAHHGDEIMDPIAAILEEQETSLSISHLREGEMAEPYYSVTCIDSEGRTSCVHGHGDEGLKELDLPHSASSYQREGSPKPALPPKPANLGRRPAPLGKSKSILDKPAPKPAKLVPQEAALAYNTAPPKMPVKKPRKSKRRMATSEKAVYETEVIHQKCSDTITQTSARMVVYEGSYDQARPPKPLPRGRSATKSTKAASRSKQPGSKPRRKASYKVTDVMAKEISFTPENFKLKEDIYDPEPLEYKEIRKVKFDPDYKVHSLPSKGIRVLDHPIPHGTKSTTDRHEETLEIQQKRQKRTIEKKSYQVTDRREEVELMPERKTTVPDYSALMAEAIVTDAFRGIFEENTNLYCDRSEETLMVTPKHQLSLGRDPSGRKNKMYGSNLKKLQLKQYRSSTGSEASEASTSEDMGTVPKNIPMLRDLCMTRVQVMATKQFGRIHGEKSHVLKSTKQKQPDKELKYKIITVNGHDYLAVDSESSDVEQIRTHKLNSNQMDISSSEQSSTLQSETSPIKRIRHEVETVSDSSTDTEPTKKYKIISVDGHDVMVEESSGASTLESKRQTESEKSSTLTSQRSISSQKSYSSQGSGQLKYKIITIDGHDIMMADSSSDTESDMIRSNSVMSCDESSLITKRIKYKVVVVDGQEVMVEDTDSDSDTLTDSVSVRFAGDYSTSEQDSISTTRDYSTSEQESIASGHVNVSDARILTVKVDGAQLHIAPDLVSKNQSEQCRKQEKTPSKSKQSPAQSAKHKTADAHIITTKVKRAQVDSITEHKPPDSKPPKLKVTEKDKGPPAKKGRISDTDAHILTTDVQAVTETITEVQSEQKKRWSGDKMLIRENTDNNPSVIATDAEMMMVDVDTVQKEELSTDDERQHEEQHVSLDATELKCVANDEEEGEYESDESSTQTEDTVQDLRSNRSSYIENQAITEESEQPKEESSTQNEDTVQDLRSNRSSYIENQAITDEPEQPKEESVPEHEYENVIVKSKEEPKGDERVPSFITVDIDQDGVNEKDEKCLTTEPVVENENESMETTEEDENGQILDGSELLMCDVNWFTGD